MMTPRRPAGLRLIITYKTAKAVLQLGAAAVLLYGAGHGLAAELAAFADSLREHATHVWSGIVATALLDLTRQRHGIVLVGTALACDAAVSSLEAWALMHGRRWGNFLVVGATALLLPFEIVALAHRVRPGRLILLVVNAAIVAYLLRRIRNERLRFRH